MSNDATQIVVGSGGAIYIAPEISNPSLPTSVNATLSSFSEMGYISEEGISASFGVEVADIAAFQSLLPVRRVVTGRTADISFTMRQWNAGTFAVALGGGSYELTASGDYRFNPPEDGDALQELTAVVEWQDGTKKYRLVIPRCVIVENVETSIVRDAAADLPVTLSVLGVEGQDAWYMITDDPAFDTGLGS